MPRVTAEIRSTFQLSKSVTITVKRIFTAKMMIANKDDDHHTPDDIRNVVRKKTGLCGKNSQRGGGV